MALRSQRFGVSNLQGARSSEWVVAWKTNSADVYVATRTLGTDLKVSIHASGRCHIRAPNPKKWRGQGPAPAFVEQWSIDPGANYEYPLAIIIPDQELRVANWTPHAEKGTVWLNCVEGLAKEVALFLVRTEEDPLSALHAAGWTELVVDAPLPDGRRLLVAASDASLPRAKISELDAVRTQTKRLMSTHPAPNDNPRMILTATTDRPGTMKLLEASLQ